MRRGYQKTLLPEFDRSWVILTLVFLFQQTGAAQLTYERIEGNGVKDTTLIHRTFWTKGDTLQPLKLVTMRGEFTELSEVLGDKKSVVVFFKADCPVCHENAGFWIHLHELSKKTGKRVIGIALWSRDADFADVRRFSDSFKIDFPLYLVRRSDLNLQFKDGVSIPQLLLCQPDRVILRCWRGAITANVAIDISAAIAKE
jgi:peroxiredoxin